MREGKEEQIAHFSPSEIYPAPPLTGDGTISRTELERLAREPSGALACFALGNLLLRSAEFQQAAEIFERALLLQLDLPELRVNFGISLMQLGRLDDALIQLRRALLADPRLLIAHRSCARIYLLQGELPLAEQSYERLLNVAPKDPDALLGLAQIAEAQRDPVVARSRYEELLKFMPHHEIAENALARFDFALGLTEFQANRLDQAFRIWGESYRRFPRSYSSDQKIVTELRQLVERYQKARHLEGDLRELQQAYRLDPQSKKPFYPFVSRFLFSIGLFPEGWESVENLAGEYQRWATSLETEGEHPYPHFRFSLIHLYRGDLEPALQELTLCQDRFLPKKQRAIKLKELFELARIIGDVQSRREEFVNMERPLDEWERAGFTNPFQAQVWRESGLAPAEAFLWMQAGFSAKQAVRWSKFGISLIVAREWSDAGFSEPAEVRTWTRGDFTAADALRWLDDCPLPIDQIIQSRKAGLDNPTQAFAWSKLFQFPFDAARWHEQGFTPADAEEWIANGFREPFQAADWRSRGHAPSSALREFNKGSDVKVEAVDKSSGVSGEEE